MMDKSKPPPGWYQLDEARMLYHSEFGLQSLEGAWNEAEEAARPFAEEAVEQIASWVQKMGLAAEHGGVARGHEASKILADAIRRGDWKR